jgi:hypothetical protein
VRAGSGGGRNRGHNTRKTCLATRSPSDMYRKQSRPQCRGGGTNKQYLFVVYLPEQYGSSDYTASNGRMINELERIWQEAIVSYFEVLHHQHFLDGTEESHDSRCFGLYSNLTLPENEFTVLPVSQTARYLTQDSWFAGQDTNPESPEYKAEVLPTGSRHSVQKMLETQNEDGAFHVQ